MFEMSQKELAGQSELPGQEKREDRKEHKESASMSDRAKGYVENDEAGKPRSSGFSQQIARCEGKEEGCKDRNQVMLRMGGKGKV